MDEKVSTKKRPILKIIEKGLQLWLRSKCEAVNDISLELNGSTTELLRGRLESIKVIAEEIIFNRLPIENIKLESKDLNIRFNIFNSNERLVLKESFEVKGTVSFRGSELNKILLNGPWSWLGDWLAKELMDSIKLNEFKLEDESLLLEVITENQTEKISASFSISAKKGRLFFKRNGQENEVYLPMDQSIIISDVILNGGLIYITGKSIVKT